MQLTDADSKQPLCNMMQHVSNVLPACEAILKPNRFKVSMYRRLLILAPPTKRAKRIQSSASLVVFLQIRFQEDKEITPFSCGSSPGDIR